MPTWLKVVLGIVLFVFVLIAVGVFFAVRWFKTNAPELKQQAEAVAAEGESFGKGRDGNACIDEALARLDRDGSFMGQVRHQLFLSACLRTADVPPEFCATVPARNEIQATVKWTINECARRGRAGNQPCTRLLGAVQERCHPR